jgi:alpha-methylacyl-CoA racemase
VGDYGGGSLYLVVGILAALHEARSSGRGQVVDAAISDGVHSMMSLFVSSTMRGRMSPTRGANMLDGGAPYYRAYATSDGQHLAIGAIEPQFFAQLCDLIDVPHALRGAQLDKAQWPQLHAALEDIFLTRSRAEWTALLEGTDVCFAPVLTLSEASAHPHNRARDAYVDVQGVSHPAPAPRFSRTPSQIQGPAPARAQAVQAAIARWSS